MSRVNLPYIVEVHIIYGSDIRKRIEITPWKNIENEIDDQGNVNLFSKELMKLIPSVENGEDCEVYAAKLIKKPAKRSEYICCLLKEFGCCTYQQYCEKTKTPPPKTKKMFLFDSGNINRDINQILGQSFATKQFKTKSSINTISSRKARFPIFTTPFVLKKEVDTRSVSFTKPIDNYGEYGDY